MNDVQLGVVETAPKEKIEIKPIGWGWIKKFQRAQLDLIRATETLKGDILDDDETYNQAVDLIDVKMAKVQGLLCAIIKHIPASLIVEEGVSEIDLTDPEQLDYVDQDAVQGLMLDLSKRVGKQEQAEKEAKN